ncbi:MAG: hypothetical protein A3A86_04160 [Elusimicrobia bacterium RIFCSPLOWO2_01_FULL_60_11]|nr:MAG: hypothetical protein A3A86_04160 [Elusimicrobia bacterium RIFCSPLOWO2_01_FULL_60_11]
MGDLFQVTPTLRALKNWRKDIILGLVIQDRNLPVFRDNPRLDRLHVYRKRELNGAPWKIFSFLRGIRREKYDLAVTLETQRTHLTNDLIALFSGAPYRLRQDGAPFGNPGSNAFYNLLSPVDGGAAHQVDKNFSVFAPYGIRLENRSLEFFVPDDDLASAKEILQALGAPLPSIAIHPGSYKLANRWPLASYLGVAQVLRDKGMKGVFVLGPSESDWRGEIEKAGFPVVSGVSITEMAGIFRLSGAVLCNDTGVMHIAGAVGARTVALFGRTEPDEWKPPGDAVRFLRAPDKNIASIPAERVLEALS